MKPLRLHGSRWHSIYIRHDDCKVLTDSDGAVLQHPHGWFRVVNTTKQALRRSVHSELKCNYTPLFLVVSQTRSSLPSFVSVPVTCVHVETIVVSHVVIRDLVSMVRVF